MKSTNAVLAAMIAADNLIDKLELATDVFNNAEMVWLANYQTAAASATRADHDVMLPDFLKKYLDFKCKGKLADADAVMVALCATNGPIDKLELATTIMAAGQRDQLSKIQTKKATQGWEAQDCDIMVAALAHYVQYTTAYNI